MMKQVYTILQPAVRRRHGMTEYIIGRTQRTSLTGAIVNITGQWCL